MKKFLSVVLAVLMCAALFAACSSGGSTPAQSSGGASQTQTQPSGSSGAIDLVIPHYKVGANAGAKFFEPQIERFNAKYEGVYHITIEEVPNDMYPDKVKQLGVQGMYPALVEGVVTDTMILEDIVPNNKFYDLNQWLDKDPELKARLLETTVNHNTFDGKLFSITYPVTRPTTMYYNPELYTPSKDIGQMSWDELLADLGDNKIAFMTAENAWTTMIALSSMIAVQPGGPELLIESVPDDKKIKDFNNPIIVTAIAELQKVLQTAASKNAVGAGYADAANTFMSKGAAIICNGSWMVDDFAPASAEKWSNGFDGSVVRSSTLPGNVGLDNLLGYGWWIPSTTPPEQAEAAWAYIAFINSPEELETYMLAEGGTAPNLALSDEFLAKRAENRLLDEYVGSVNKDTIIVPYFANAIPNSIGEIEFGKLLPKLIDGSYTPEAFCAELTKKAAETN